MKTDLNRKWKIENRKRKTENDHTKVVTSKSTFLAKFQVPARPRGPF